MSIDHRELLKKYIRHIIDCEGIAFVDDSGACDGHINEVFTPEEGAVLRALVSEAYSEKHPA